MTTRDPVLRTSIRAGGCVVAAPLSRRGAGAQVGEIVRLDTPKDKTHRLAVELFSGFCEEQGP
jgi:hypothetical protein